MPQISETTLKLPKLSREDVESRGIVKPNIFNQISGSTIFPEDLTSEKTISIHVYDTTKADNVYNGLLDTTQNVMASGAEMFKGALDKGASIIPGQTGESLSGFLDKITVDIPKTSGGWLGTAGQGLGDVFRNTLSSFSNVNISLGNAKLFNRYNYYETFYLPIPNDIQESISNEYEEKLGWINDAPLMKEDSAIRKGLDTFSQKSAVWAKMSGARSLKYWENKIQMYSSSSFREITLSWNLVPNNRRESRIIHEIVRKIKMYGSPESVAGKIMIKSPCYFGIEFNNITLNRALQFQEVVLISASIEYVPGGSMETFKDGQPKQIQLSLAFRDRQPKLQEDWASPIGIGNGPSMNENSCPTK